MEERAPSWKSRYKVDYEARMSQISARLGRSPSRSLGRSYPRSERSSAKMPRNEFLAYKKQR